MKMDNNATNENITMFYQLPFNIYFFTHHHGANAQVV
jgi:hypothetical protein